MMIIAVDPGVSGAVAWQHDGEVRVANMPETPLDILNLFQSLSDTAPRDSSVTIERVDFYVPGNSGQAMVTFAENKAYIKMALIASQIPFNPPLGVSPKTWQNAIGVPQKPLPKLPKPATLEEKRHHKNQLTAIKVERKRTIKDMMQRRFPHIKVTLANADALGILTWKLQTQNQQTSTVALF